MDWTATRSPPSPTPPLLTSLGPGHRAPLHSSCHVTAFSSPGPHPRRRLRLYPLLPCLSSPSIARSVISAYSPYDSRVESLCFEDSFLTVAVLQSPAFRSLTSLSLLHIFSYDEDSRRALNHLPCLPSPPPPPSPSTSSSTRSQTSPHCGHLDVAYDKDTEVASAVCGRALSRMVWLEELTVGGYCDWEVQEEQLFFLDFVAEWMQPEGAGRDGHDGDTSTGG